MMPDTVGKRIKQLRQARGMSQRELARLAEVSQGLLSLIEKGERRGSGISVEAARKIAFALGVSLDALVGVPQDDSGSESEPAGVVMVGA